ncbi:MAG: hypothetical protein PHN38_01050 [Sulfurospirillaceae bacterium]|nr:hypothetical protein [Sulfurospirillaceae bacterium]
MKKISKLFLGALVGFMTLASNASAAVTYTEGTGFAGTFDLTPYYSAIGIVITAIAVVAAIRLALGTFKRV